jgi:hypothetical protein
MIADRGDNVMLVLAEDQARLNLPSERIQADDRPQSGVSIARLSDDRSTVMGARKPSSLLTLPAELRIRIYECHLPDALAVFADTTEPPTLLQTSRQLRSEFADVFYGSEYLKLDAYYSNTDAWCPLAAASAKRAVLEGARIQLKDLADFWSLASARRYCQHVVGDRGRGIMTVVVKGGFKRWMWSTA